MHYLPSPLYLWHTKQDLDMSSCSTCETVSCPHPHHQRLGHMLPCAGAVVFALIQAVEQGQGSTYNTLLRAMRYSLKNGPQHFASTPELSASWDFDLNRPFLL